MSISVVTPVYNERPEVFLAALESWRAEGPDEIIAVIDHSDVVCQDVFSRFSRFGAEHDRTYLIVTGKPGKRPALTDGIRAATCDIVALVDSDTLWNPGVLRSALAPFHDPAVGGVATRQRVLAPRTIAQKIFDLQLNQRYEDEVPFLSATGDVLRCLSGRTAFYRRPAVLPLLDDLEHETFLGQQVVSGDDKRLTYLVQAAGWKTTYQSTAVVWTPGMTTLRAFLKQRLRWSRNSWRADLKILRERWVWRHPMFAFHLLDTFIQPFVSLLSPLLFLVSLVLGLWIPALLLLTWWLATRFIRLSPHFSYRPADILLLPVFVASSFFIAGIRLYALFSLGTQGWITRWDTARLPHVRTFQRVFPTVATAVVLAGMTTVIVLTHFLSLPLLTSALQ